MLMTVCLLPVSLSGLSPFLGDDDNETLNNILACKWNFEEQEFVDTSEEAKDFISKLLIVNKRYPSSYSAVLLSFCVCDCACVVIFLT